MASDTKMPVLKRTRSDVTPGGTYARKIKKARKTPRRIGQTKSDAMRQARRLIPTNQVAINPLPKVYRTTVTYPIAYNTIQTAIANYVDTRIALNDIYAFDYDANLGSGQPLFFDQLCSSTGPYKNFRVQAWRVKFTIDNLKSVNSMVVAGQGYPNNAEADTFAELYSLPNAQKRMLQWYGGGPCARTVIEMNGKTKDFKPHDEDENLIGSYNSSPSTIIYGALAANCIDQTTGPSIAVMVHAEFDVEFFNQDATAS